MERTANTGPKPTTDIDRLNDAYNELKAIRRRIESAIQRRSPTPEKGEGVSPDVKALPLSLLAEEFPSLAGVTGKDLASLLEAIGI